MNIPPSWLLRRISQIILDVLVFGAAVFGAYLARFEGFPEGRYARQLLIVLPCLVLARALSFRVFRIYRIVWKYISIRDVLSIMAASLPASALVIALRLVPLPRPSLWQVPLGVAAVEYLLAVAGASGIRMLRRLAYEGDKAKLLARDTGQLKRVLLIGAGDAGNSAVRELKNRTDLGMTVVGFIDDDEDKIGTTLQGFPVLGATAQIPVWAKRRTADEAIITIANASSADIRRISDICRAADLRVRIIPGVFEMLDEQVRLSKVREINIDDLLGRSAVSFEDGRTEIMDKYRGRGILITGGGGSIGSELCRQLAALHPRELVILDKDENGIFEIDSELQALLAGCPTVSVVADIRDRAGLERILMHFRPQFIFHAAAHKQVPLMERNVSEAVLNNVVGTRNAAELAGRLGIENFVYISTDKAIRPSSVMGATKKVGEVVVQRLASGRTRFSCVRFGNVLGSRGSVVPLFRKQIAAGGPVTVTHPEVRRYIMSIAEAVQLIILAGTLGRDGQIFVLDMGPPIRILDLARDMIRLSGFEEEEVGIRFTGLRPGEKLYEEVLVDQERVRATSHRKIFIEPASAVDEALFSGELERMIRAAEGGRDAEVLEALSRMDIGYQAAGDGKSGLPQTAAHFRRSEEGT